jgi:hypothetical protein
MTEISPTSQENPAFPDEAFPCPYCGQMLAPSCRVCVACKSPIDPHQIVRPAPPAPERNAAAEPGKTGVPAEHARFSWNIFFTVLVVWVLAAIISQLALGYDKGQLALAGIVLASSLWVFNDAQQKRIPKPFRWGIGCVLLWIVVFPWYLSRRRTPKADCPFIEGEAGPLAKALLILLAILFIAGAIVAFLKGPPVH